MPELILTLEAKQKARHNDQRFFAALQGIDMDDESESGGQKQWEDMKARVFSGGVASDSNDIVSLQGQSAAQAGFGIGMGLDYEVIE